MHTLPGTMLKFCRQSSCNFTIHDCGTPHISHQAKPNTKTHWLWVTCTIFYSQKVPPFQYFPYFLSNFSPENFPHLNAKVASVTAPLRSPLIRFKSAWMQIASTKRGSNFRASHPKWKNWGQARQLNDEESTFMIWSFFSSNQAYQLHKFTETNSTTQLKSYFDSAWPAHNLQARLMGSWTLSTSRVLHKSNFCRNMP